MADETLLSILISGPEQWNAWRRDNRHVRAFDLSGARLRRVNLTGADLRDCNLSRADLREANLENADCSGAILSNISAGQANFTKARLVRANLWWASLWKTNLSDANLAEAELWHANLVNTTFRGANLSSVDLTGARLVETDLSHSNLAGAQVYGIAAWNVCLEGAIQTDLVITPPHEPRITVDDLEFAQFLYLLLSHRKLRAMLNAVTQRGVLILGRFSDGGIELLRFIGEHLRRAGYLPIIFDFDRPEHRDLTETVKTLVGLSRFVVANLNGPSVPQELYASVPFFSVPLVPLIERGMPRYAMFIDLLKYPWVLSPVEYVGREHLGEILQTQVIDAAEEKHRARQVMLEELFPRR